MMIIVALSAAKTETADLANPRKPTIDSHNRDLFDSIKKAHGRYRNVLAVPSIAVILIFILGVGLNKICVEPYQPRLTTTW